MPPTAPRTQESSRPRARRSRLARGLALLTLFVATACATNPVGPTDRVFPRVPGDLPVARVATVPGIELPSLYPGPPRAEYGDRLLPLDGAHYVDENSAEFDTVLQSAGLEAGWPRLPLEGYALIVTADRGRTVVLRAARDEEGTRWAQRAFEQLSVLIEGRSYARSCRVLDWPAFHLRGNKRPRSWERAYRANFSWGLSDGEADSTWTRLVHVAPKIPFDASQAAVEELLAGLAPFQDDGVRAFALKFDDVGFRLTPQSELAFRRFPRALVSFVERVRLGLVQRDADVRLYLLPQTYWWNDPRLEPFADAVRRAGGLHPELGLVFSGPEVISDTIDPAGLFAARKAFGLHFAPALIYDNQGREGDWGPLTGRDPLLRQQLDGVFGERGTPVHRLTRLDWSWNPDDYDPERSWSRALLELVGPQAFATFRSVCRVFRDDGTREDAEIALRTFESAPGEDWSGPLSRAELLELLRADLARLDRAEEQLSGR